MRTVLPTPAPPKSPIFPPFVRSDQVDDLDARFKNFRCGALLRERRRLAVNAGELSAEFALAVDGLAERVHDASDHLLAYRDENTVSRALHLKSAGKSVRGFERNAAANTARTMGEHFNVYRAIAVQDVQQFVLIGQMVVEFDIDNRTDDLYDRSDVCFRHN